jgi:FAD dependent oxidoreductase TIGR03364
MSADMFDDAVIGAGIVGLAHAYQLASRGRRVVVLERHDRARGASVRNFGMLWPIGQPAGSLRELAMRSREIWLDVLSAARLWHDAVGSLHVACADDEAQVLVEFAERAVASDFPCELLDPVKACALSPFLRREGLRLALWSDREVCVDPRSAVAGLPEWLHRSYGVQFEFGAEVTHCDSPWVSAGERSWQADRIWLCAGDELRRLFPEALGEQNLVACKLQMMRSQPFSQRIGPMLAGGLTLRHYRAFEACPTLSALRARVTAELADYEQYGIHVMVSQNGCGELVLGDSHEYGDRIEPFDKTVIDDLILKYLRRFFHVPELAVASRWHGVYVKHATDPYVVVHPAEHVVAVTGLGGHGMTMSFGVAEAVVRDALD